MTFPAMRVGVSRSASHEEEKMRSGERHSAPALPMRGTSQPTSSRWLALVILCTGFLMIVLDMTIVNVALPSIKSDLSFSQAGLAWVVNAYLIAFAGFMLLAGRLGDLIGRKRIFLAGLVMFTAASLLCGLSINQPMLVAARFVQGIGGAVSSAVILGMIMTMFPEPAERARAIGVFSSSPRRAPRLACSPVASSRRRSAGIGSSSSISRSG